jgi:hypothetical protein
MAAAETRKRSFVVCGDLELSPHLADNVRSVAISIRLTPIKYLRDEKCPNPYTDLGALFGQSRQMDRKVTPALKKETSSPH